MNAVEIEQAITDLEPPLQVALLDSPGEVWARDMSRDEIELGRQRDKRLRDTHLADVNRRREEA